ncbi:MAG: kinase [Bacteroidetes bacterium]|nr:kinase [Bacteroidota bacterium]
MPQIWNNTIAVTREELLSNGVISLGWYRKYSKELNVVRSKGFNQTALYSFRDLPLSVREKYKAVLGDPEAKQQPAPLATDPQPADLGYDIITDEKAYSHYTTKVAKELVQRYTNDASILNAWLRRYNERYATIRNCGHSTASLMTQELNYLKAHLPAISEQYPNTLPSSERRLRERINDYQKMSYDGIVSGKANNQNTRKIKGEAAEWLLARYASPVHKVTVEQLWQEYNKMAAQKEGWKILKSKSPIRHFLNEPQNRKVWTVTRLGELKAKEMMTRQHRTVMPMHRDALWYGDGTKVNYYYQYTDEKGTVQMGTAVVYEVMDAYSECFIGYAIGNSENYELQYAAFRMAVQTAAQKPYEVRYDNQGGHKKLRNQNFLTDISRLSINTKPYNGKSKTIELAFGRFQQEYLQQDWFFTGQNVTAKKEISKANMEMILANRHNLPTLKEVEEIYCLRREEWNNSRHPHSRINRSHMYSTSHNPMCEKIDTWQFVDLFWLTTDKAITYRNNGIEIQVNKQSYAFEVLTPDGAPDDDFRNYNISKKFFVKYDPMDVDTMVHLYEETVNGLRYIATAQPYIMIHRAIQDQQDGEMAFIQTREHIEREERTANLKYVEELLQKHGLHPEQHGLNMPSLKGVKTTSKKAKQPKDDYGKLLKEESMADELTDDNALTVARSYY